MNSYKNIMKDIVFFIFIALISVFLGGQKSLNFLDLISMLALLELKKISSSLKKLLKGIGLDE